MTWRVHVASNIPMGMIGHTMYVGWEGFDGRLSIVTNLTLKTQEPMTPVSDKDFALKDGMMAECGDVRGLLQAMSDAAWEIGIKPKQIEDNSNELKATKYHLEDMRQLA